MQEEYQAGPRMSVGRLKRRSNLRRIPAAAARAKHRLCVRMPERFHSSLISALNNQGKMQWHGTQRGPQRGSSDTLSQTAHQAQRHPHCRQGPSRQTRQRVARSKNTSKCSICPLTARNSIDEYLNNDLKQTIASELVNSSTGQRFPVHALDSASPNQFLSTIQKPNTLLDVFYIDPAE